MFEKIVAWLRGIMTRMLGEQAKGAEADVPHAVAVSDDMARAIERWHSEYTGHAPWLYGNRQSLNLAAQIASEVATLVTLEAKIDLTGSERAEWMQKQMKPVYDKLQMLTEYACAMGGIVLKPAQCPEGLAVDMILADDFYPVAFNSRGKITSAAFVERKYVGQMVYSRVEHHSVTDKGYVITNKAYKGYNDEDLGREIKLTDVPEWSNLAEETRLDNITFPLFAYFRMPFGNAVDPKSPLGVSVFAKAEKNIEEADKQYQRLLWEYEGGELAIHASEDAFEMDGHGRAIIPHGRERLYRPLAYSTGTEGGKPFETFSPALRDSSYISGMDTILQKIEDQCGLARGALSDRSSERVQIATATEIKMQRQRTFATVTAIQGALEDALGDLVRAMDATATLYNLAPQGEINLSCVWDDSIVTDTDTERQRDLQEIRDGIMQKYEYRMKWYGEDEQTARSKIEDTAPSDDELIGFAHEGDNPQS